MLKNCWEMFGDNHKVILLTAELLMFSGRWGIIISSYVAYQTPVESSRPMAIQTAMDKLSGSLNKENRHEWEGAIQREVGQVDGSIRELGEGGGETAQCACGQMWDFQITN